MQHLLYSLIRIQFDVYVFLFHINFFCRLMGLLFKRISKKLCLLLQFLQNFAFTYARPNFCVAFNCSFYTHSLPFWERWGHCCYCVDGSLKEWVNLIVHRYKNHYNSTLYNSDSLLGCRSNIGCLWKRSRGATNMVISTLLLVKCYQG
jgi:hypothetical protein